MADLVVLTDPTPATSTETVITVRVGRTSLPMIVSEPVAWADFDATTARTGLFEGTPHTTGLFEGR